MIHRFRFGKRTAARHSIEIFVERIEQLFNSMDPSPFYEKDLDRDAEEFIVSWAQEFHRHDPLVLRIHVNQFPAAADAPRATQAAIHNYFSYRCKLNRLELKRLLKQGRTSLIIGLFFLSACLLLGELLARREHGTLLTLMRESLTIGGWVAMWRPMQIFLYDWWPLRHLGHIYEKLSRVPVELRRPSVSHH